MSFQCPDCFRTFVRKYGLSRHLNGRCKGSKHHSDQKLEQLEQQVIRLKEQTTKEIMDLKQKPTNVLQIICVSNNDNYLDILTDRIGDFHQAIEYLRDCALSDVSGDCKLIEKIYLSPDSQNLTFLDRSKNRVVYFNEQREPIVENKDLFGRKLAHNLQTSYLKGINCLLKHEVKHLSPLDGFDIHTWNTHIYNLSDHVYQRRLVGRLNLGQNTWLSPSLISKNIQ